MKWIDNLKSVVENSETGECPFCNSYNMDYSLTICDKENSMGYGVIWCNECKKAYHISRIKVEKEHNNPIPQDLVF